MDSEMFFPALTAVAFAFGLALLAAPSLQVFRGARRWNEVVGLLISGAGFLAIGTGIVLAQRGLGFVVLIGIVTTVVGHAVQRRAAKA